MCNITDKLSDVKVGFKVLAYDGNTKKFYSTFTGQEIGIGKVPLPPKTQQRMSYSWIECESLFITASFFKSNFAGKTSAFIDIGHAKSLLVSLWESKSVPLQFVITKVIFTGNVFKGTYGFNQEVIAGNMIESIEIIEIEEVYQ